VNPHRAVRKIQQGIGKFGDVVLSHGVWVGLACGSRLESRMEWDVLGIVSARICM